MHATLLRSGLVIVASIGLAAASIACQATTPEPGAGTPFSLGGNSVVTGFTPTPTAFTSAPPAAEGSPTAQAQPTSSGSPVAGGIEIGSVGNTLAFDKDSLSVSAGGSVTLTFHNAATSAALQHDWVLVKAGTIDEVAGAGLAAGAGAGWLPANDTNVLAHTGLVDGGKSQTITFQAPAAGTYDFLCSFPGHSSGMHGTVTVK